MSDSRPSVTMRRACEADISIFVRLQSDNESAYLAAFGAVRNAEENAAHWADILRDADTETHTILAGDEPRGYVGMFRRGADYEITYWLDRAVWGRGIAEAALRSFVREVPFRPLFTRVAADNTRSVRVLEKCGFHHVNTERAGARQRRTAHLPARALHGR